MMSSDVLDFLSGDNKMARSDLQQKQGQFTLFGEKGHVNSISERFLQNAPVDRAADYSLQFDNFNSTKDAQQTCMNLGVPGTDELKVDIDEDLMNFLKDNSPPISELAWDGTEITRSSQNSPRSPLPVPDLWNVESHLKMSSWVTDSILKNCFTPLSLTPPMTPSISRCTSPALSIQLEEARKPVPSMLAHAEMMRQKQGSLSETVPSTSAGMHLVSGLNNLRLNHGSVSLDEPVTSSVVTGEQRKWLNCNICSKSFISKDLMLGHQSSEHQSFHQLHRCKSCPFVCKRRSAMKLHLAKVHSAEMLQCPQCPERFSLQWSLDDHMRKCHVFYKCNTCKRPIGDIGDANSFVFHNLSRKCLKCDEDFSCVTLYVQHSLQHSQAGWCPLCPAYLEDSRSMDEHIEWSHTGPFKQVHCF